MPKFTTRHYVEIGTVLRETDASDEMLDAFIKMFKRDNEKFNEGMFRKFVEYTPKKVRVR